MNQFLVYGQELVNDVPLLRGSLLLSFSIFGEFSSSNEVLDLELILFLA